MPSISYHINRVLRFTPGTLSNIKIGNMRRKKKWHHYKRNGKDWHSACYWLSLPGFWGKCSPS